MWLQEFQPASELNSYSGLDRCLGKISAVAVGLMAGGSCPSFYCALRRPGMKEVGARFHRHLSLSR